MKYGYCSLFTLMFASLPGNFFSNTLKLLKFYHIHLVFLFLSQDDSLIKCAKENDLSGIKDAVSRGADVNATDSVSFIIITLNFTH